MRVSLFYNQKAGDRASLSQIEGLLRDQGHEIVRIFEKGTDPERLFDERADVVAAAGGDGTVSTVARVLVGQGIPLGILPLGTANNIAKSLGIDSSIAEVAKRWKRACRQPLDLGVASGQWGESRFVEGVGVGLIPAGITALEARPVEDETRAARVAHAVRRHRKVLSQLKSHRYTVTLDGTRTTGDFLLIEVLNIRSVGPNLVLSEDADPSDGFFSVVMAGEEHREQLARYFQDRSEQPSATLSLPTQRARHIDIQGCEDVHVDDEVLSCPSVGNVSIQIEPAALEVLV